MTTKNRRFILLVLLGAVALGALTFRRHFGEVPNAIARRFIKSRQLEAAQRWLERAKRISPGNAQTEFLLARLARKRGLQNDTRKHLQTAWELGYSKEAIEREQWLALAQSGQMTLAEQHLAEMLTDPRGDGAEICEAFTVGYLKNRDETKARQLIEVWKADFPNDAQPHYFEGMIFQEVTNWKQAIACYQGALERQPDHAPAALALGECLSAAKRPTEALSAFETAAAHAVDNRAALVGKAKCLQALERHQQARTLLEGIVADSPNHVEASLELAQLELAEGNYAAALQLVEPLSEKHPRNHDLQYVYAVALRNNGQIEAAKPIFEKVTKAQDQLVRAVNLAEKIEGPDIDERMQIGKIHYEFGNRQEGVMWLLSVLNYEPQHPEANRLLAEYYETKSNEDATYGRLAKKHRARIESGKADSNSSESG